MLPATHCVAPGLHATHAPLKHTGVGPEQAAQEAPAKPHEEFDSEPTASHVPFVPPLQQPLAQVFASQVQVPLVLSHRPFAHDPHEAPPVPHEVEDSDPHASQVPPLPPLQHPSGQEVESQTHVPLPLLHSSPELQAPQLAPAVPHSELLSDPQGRHVPVGPPLQQPAGHEVASQTHCPLALLHSSPEPHGWHVAPPAPHDPFDSLASTSHELPLQQPAHDEPPHEHTPLEHVCPPPQPLHAAPPVPHELVDCPEYASQAPPAVQQPFGHDAPLQTHWPAALHVWPPGQAPQAAPPVPQELADCEE